MKKQIVFCGLIFSSFMFGMENAERQLELSCKLEGPAEIRSFFPVAFKVPQKDLYFSYIRATMTNPCNTPDHFKVLLSPRNYARLDDFIVLDSRAYLHDGTYSDSILDKQQTIKKLQKFFRENRTENNNPAQQVLMTFEASGERHFLLFETSELPQSIKDACDIKSMSKAEIRNYYILIPLLVFSFLFYQAV